MTGKGNSKYETWVIIMRVYDTREMVEKPNPVLGNWGLPIREEANVRKEEVVDRFALTEPMIIIPRGVELDRVEVIPISKPLVIHSQNFKRRFG